MFVAFTMTLENLFLVLNLGCEMVYVIDQRLMAQKVAADKSAQGEEKQKILQQCPGLGQVFPITKQCRLAERTGRKISPKNHQFFGVFPREESETTRFSPECGLKSLQGIFE